jgi:ABC-type transport system involved in multi-copper enzyme maturation permease subunit
LITKFHLQQVLTIAQIELRRAFFSKRAFWVYLLALFPSVIFFGHAIEAKFLTGRFGPPVPAAWVDGLREGDSIEAIGEKIPFGRIRRWRGREGVRMERLVCSDGRRRVMLTFEDGKLTDKNVRNQVDIEEDKQIFAGVFQYFYLRLAVFFGCLGIFMNLFRGEMLDKTLHFWFLMPARREVLLAGKYLAGLTASIVIFTAGAVLCFALMMWAQFPEEGSAYWNSTGPEHLARYAAAAVLACAGYGSVFLAAGLLLRNPIVPAVILLLWEGINGFLPVMLQKMSVLYYVQSLCPIPPPMDAELPVVMRLLLAPAEPASPAGAVLGIGVVTALVLVAASRAVRRLEINYGTE